jgi:hypothetical protein
MGSKGFKTNLDSIHKTNIYKHLQFWQVTFLI